MRTLFSKITTYGRPSVWAWLLIGLVLSMHYLAGWFTVELTRISKENDLEAHLTDLGRLAPGMLQESALGLADLAMDASLESTAQNGGADAPDPAVYREGLDNDLTEPLARFAKEARLAQVVLLSDRGRVLYDTDQPGRLIVPYDFWEIDRQEIEQALRGVPAASPAYTTGKDAFKRYYIPITEKVRGNVPGQPAPTGQVRAVLGLVAGRTYLAGIEHLSRRLTHLNLVMTVLMLLIGLLIQQLVRRQRRIELQAVESDRLAGLGTLAAGFAHELRNPLEIIRAFTEDLERSLLTGRAAHEEALEACRDIVEEVDRMNRLVGQFLSYSRSRMEDPLSELAGKTPVLATARSVLTMLRPSVEKRHLTLALELAKGGGFSPEQAAQAESWTAALGDGAFRQVLINLTLNAIQASPEAGRVTLSVKATARQIELQVADEGPGIAEKERQRIFEPFYSTRQTGSGLGLAVSRQIATHAGGSLKLDPARPSPGGACFILTLPRAKDAPPVRASAEAEPAHNAPKESPR
jgi:signal transduction histidine kinase